MLKSSTWSPPFKFSNQNFIYISQLSHTYNMPPPTLFDLIILILFAEEYNNF
jgi:hypothetical protein